MTTTSKSTTLVQIGVGSAKSGRNPKWDDMYNATLHAPTPPALLLLVEPNPLHLEAIEDAYKNMKSVSWENVRIENVAIAVDDQKEVDLYYHPRNGPLFEVASLDPKHVCKHGDFKEHELEVLKVPTMSIQSLFDKHNIKEVDLLVIDTEGMDDTILKTIDFSKYKIHRLIFENCHIKDEGIYEYLETQGLVIAQRHFGDMGWNTFAVSKDLVR